MQRFHAAISRVLSDKKELPELQADGAHGETEMPVEKERNTKCSDDPNTRCSGDPNTRCSVDPNTRCSGDPNTQCRGDPSMRCSGDPNTQCISDLNTSPQYFCGRVIFRAT